MKVVAQVDDLFVVPFHKPPLQPKQNWNHKNSRSATRRRQEDQ